MTPLAVFVRFLSFGCRAWGGPVAQIEMLRAELIEREAWIEPSQFARVLALFQVLPGPEAHELCVYLGAQRAGRWGGVLAGLGFMLPGTALMLVLAWAYQTRLLDDPRVVAGFAGMQLAVLGLMTRAVYKLGRAFLTGALGLGLAIYAAIASALGVHFAAVLAISGLLAVVMQQSSRVLRLGVLGLAVLLSLAAAPSQRPSGSEVLVAGTDTRTLTVSAASISGLKVGLLTFGGAYTAVPVLRQDLVVERQLLGDRVFLDGLALASIIPAPMIIFVTFAGYLTGGLTAALAITAGAFLPSFLFTLMLGRQLDFLANHPRLHRALDGIAAALVGVVAVTTAQLAAAIVDSVVAGGLALLALAALVLWRSPWAVPAVVLACGTLGMALFL